MWYAVSLLLRSTHPGQPEHESLWEESIVLVRAGSEDEARQAGERIGKAKEHEYTSATGDLVRWAFAQVESVYAIPQDTVVDGTEVFSRFLRPSEVESLLTPFSQ